MSLTVRSLLAKVKPFAKDREEDRALYAIQESVRKVCRQTMMAEETLHIATTDVVCILHQVIVAITYTMTNDFWLFWYS